MAKLHREARLRERRVAKQARKEARRSAADRGTDPDPLSTEDGDAVRAEDGDATAIDELRDSEPSA